jgi:hypothetical protein
LVSGCQRKTAYLTLSPFCGIPKDFDFLSALGQGYLTHLKLYIQRGSHVAPELTFQSDELLARILDVSELIQQLLGIAGPSLVKEG